MRLHTYLTGVEVRATREGTRSKDGAPFWSIRCEDMDGEPFEITCSNVSLFGTVASLKKGDVIDCKVVVMATRDYQFVALEGAPEIVTGQ